MKKDLSYLILETGEVYTGVGYGAQINAIGELVFNTSITGYQEVITDPSYKGQIVAFTYPHIGNIGTCKYDNEANQTWLQATITRELPTKPSNWRNKKNFEEYLVDNKLPGLAEIDTRKLTKQIRDKGNLLGMIVRDKIKKQDAFWQIMAYKSNNLDSKSLFSCYERIQPISAYSNNSKSTRLHIALIDFGCKISILNMLKKFNCKILTFNSDCSFVKINDLKPDAVILSNGPGNPKSYTRAIALIKDMIKEQIPILGICLGYQLLGIALGAEIEKLQFGHHGINHPVKDLTTNKVFITSQNHNYVINKLTLPSTMFVTHISLFDNSIQGFTHNEYPFVGFQGHPEGGPGPIDIQNNIVGKFLDTVCNIKKINYNYLGK
jgi:carbamoyl-phosphate synthase small subunit